MNECKWAKKLSGKGRHCNPSHNISAQATERDETSETSQANIKILLRTPNCCSRHQDFVLSVRSLSIQLLLAPDSCGRKLYLLGTGF